MVSDKHFILAPNSTIARDFAKLNGWSMGTVKIIDYPDDLCGYKNINLHVIQDEKHHHPREGMILRMAQDHCKITYYSSEVPYNEI